MTRKYIREAYDAVAPTSEEKAKMLHAILSAVPNEKPLRKEVNMKKYTKKPLVLAALVTLMVFLMGCAVVYGLKDLKIGEYAVQEGETPKPKVVDLISLQGFTGSENFKATKEWRDFEDRYDPDFKKLDEAEAAGYKAPEAYTAYPCYTQEMVDKVDAICKKYGLQPLGKSWVETKSDKMFEMLGIHGITVPNAKANFNWYSGYYFETGTFDIEVDADLNGNTYFLQYRCSMKNALDYVSLNVGNIEDYDQWNHTLADESVVLLAVSQEKALILADRDDFFVSINILNPGSMDKATLEALADSFDFSYQPKKVDAAKADVRMEEDIQEQDKEQEKLRFDAEASYNNTFRKSSYAQFLRELDDFEDGSYLLRDVTGDGVEELILIRDSKCSVGYGDEDQKIYKCKDCLVMTIKPDGLTERILTGPYDLYEGDVFGESMEYDETMDYWGRMYFRVGTDAGFDRLGDWTIVDKVMHCTSDGGSWSRSLDGDDMCELTITEAEAKEILESYRPADLDWKPVSEFPMD